jgi:hypothetical protein
MHNSTTRKHFEAQWTCTFYPPRDIQFVVYDKEIWNFTKKLLRRKSNVIVDLGAGGVRSYVVFQKLHQQS